MPMIRFEDTVGCLDVAMQGEDRFAAPHIPMDYRRVFGGQLLAQCIAVAARTTPGKGVQSLHALFPREGDLGEPLEYRVDRIHDGRSFAGRRITGRQGERTIVQALVSLHVAEPGLDHTSDPPSVPEPEACPEVDLSMIPWTTRVVDGVDLASRDVGPARYAFWSRAPDVDEDPVVHQGLLAHATDLTLIGTALRPHEGLGESDAPARIQTAVTSHTLWFHAPFRIDEWLLVSQESPRAAGARAFGLGRVHDRRGAQVASFAQESMIRPVPAG